MRTPVAALAAALFLAPAVSAEEPSLGFERSGKEVVRWTVSELSTKVAPAEVALRHEFNRGEKRYRCLPLKPLLDAAYGPGWSASEQSEAVFVATDGYSSYASAAKLAEDGGCVAFDDLDAAAWEPVGRASSPKKSDPAPFFLIWTKPHQATAAGYPWPWQIATIRLVSFAEAYPGVVPSGAPPGSRAARGFKTFQERCFRCHAMGRQGGKIGPDLNAPQSVVSYRSKRWIKDYIRAPSKYRYTEMPDHRDLQDEQLEELYEYFRLMSRRKEKEEF